MIGYEWDFPPLQSLGTVASFNPLTCIIKSESLNWETERARMASGNLVPDLGRNVAYHHEVFHWVQFQASTLGQFLLALRHARDQLVFQAALRDGAFRNVLFDPHRVSPILTYEGTREFDDRYTESTRRHLEHYRDLEVARRLTYRPQMVGFDEYPLTTALERALGYIALLERGRSGVGVGWYDAPPGQIIVSAGDGVDFETTTESVLELSAITMELLMHLTAGDIDLELLLYITDRLDGEIRAERASALAHVGQVLLDELLRTAQSGEATPLFDTAAKIGVICEIALNPPIPPVVPIAGNVSLEDLLPSTRFVRLLRVADLVGSNEAFELSPEAVTSYRDQLIAGSGIPFAVPSSDSIPMRFPGLPDTVGLPQYNWRLIRAISERFFALRHDFPELLVFFGSLVSGYRSEALIDATERSGEKWFLPPIVERPEGLRPWVSKDMAIAYLQSLATDFAMNDLVARPQLITLPHFPEAERNDLVGMVRGWISRLASHLA